MSDEFYRRQRERQEQDKPHSTLETFKIEQGEVNVGHVADPRGTDAVPPEPTLLQKILKRLGLRR